MKFLNSKSIKLFLATMVMSFSITPNSFSATKDDDLDENLTLALWGLLSSSLHLGILSGAEDDADVALSAEYLVLRDKQKEAFPSLSIGLTSGIEAFRVKTFFPMVNGKPQGIIQDMGFNLPIVDTKFFDLYVGFGGSLARLYKEFAWGGYALTGTTIKAGPVGATAEFGYRNLDAKNALVNSFTFSGSLNYEF